MIVFCAQSEASIYPAAFVILLYEEVYLQTRLFAVPIWLVQESFLQDEFSVKVAPPQNKEIPNFRMLAKQNKTKNAPTEEIRLGTDRR